MFDPQAAQRSKRDIVRDTFTSSRVGMLSWAFAAVVMGTVGLASYQFGTQSSPSSTATVRLLPSGLALPPAGDVETTASIARSSPIGIMQLRNNSGADHTPGIEQSQIEVLQREIVGLRRRLSALSEQNLNYSRRISILEKQVALAARPGGKEKPNLQKTETQPAPGVVVNELTPPSTTQAPASKSAIPQIEAEMKRPSGPAAAQHEIDRDQAAETQPEKTVEVNASPRPVSRNITLTRSPEYMPSASEPQTIPGIDTKEPVRIVALPKPSNEPLATGSIPNPNGDGEPGTFRATPTRTVAEPKIITPSEPVGRLRSGVESQIKRSDFGAVIGHYKSTASAAKAWADFKDQNEDRMRDLRPLLLERKVPEGGVALLVGPFGNAADAAIACARLLDVAEFCRPALYTGDPLVTTAEFRDTVF
ncbi:MAG: hypothetical protein K5905_11460 [Roseibium sp.]|uniref:hypothetical protein n=1 Tax=Roseibium sp. TaxID=1936156 RepID=UPI0026143D92|nr:hypothetical protein [Roseibium sp.]MCV0426082.1 hypothetical protein [Roseibium sp.]